MLNVILLIVVVPYRFYEICGMAHAKLTRYNTYAIFLECVQPVYDAGHYVYRDQRYKTFYARNLLMFVLS